MRLSISDRNIVVSSNQQWFAGAENLEMELVTYLLHSLQLYEIAAYSVSRHCNSLLVYHRTF
jgi:hypothetical protein